MCVCVPNKVRGGEKEEERRRVWKQISYQWKHRDREMEEWSKIIGAGKTRNISPYIS